MVKRTIPKIWFSADQHFGHVNILRYCARPFATIEEMAQTLTEAYRANVHPFDSVYWLGDLFMGKSIPHYVQAPPGTTMIRGNHDKAGIEDYKSMGIKEVFNSLEIEHDGEKILLVHDPMKILHAEAEKRGQPIRGKRLAWDDPIIHQLAEELPLKVFCGHVHQLFRRWGQLVNVGVDVWDYKPVTIEEALAAYKEPSILNVRQHHREIK
jgi:calcineurin-like phosphoesterase family protein